MNQKRKLSKENSLAMEPVKNPYNQADIREGQS